MKKIILLFAVFSATNFLFAQQGKLALQPDSICGKDALVWNAPGWNNGTTNYGSDDFMGAHAWTNQGTPDTARSMVQFDLSDIPVGSVVTYAYLSLFNNPTTAYAQGSHSTLSGGNDLYIQRITSSWNEHTVIWFTQPSTTTVNQVSVPASTSAHQDYPSIDVTQLVQDMVDNPGGSFGFMIRLQDEGYYRSMVFASSDYSVPNKRPLLFVNYTIPTTGCFVFQPHEGCGKDAAVWNAPGWSNGTTNYGTADFLGVHAWTNQGTPDTARGLLDFRLEAIPANAVITSAHLSLYNNPNTVYAQGQHSWLSGPNNGLIQRITSFWDDKTVTWMTQPTSTTQNQVSIPASINIHQDYPNLDVTQLVIDMINDPVTSYGFMIRLQDEAYYRSLVFASCDEPDETKNPKLEICYTILDGISGIAPGDYSIYPNPAHNSVNIMAKGNGSEQFRVSLMNILGEEVYSQSFQSAKMEIGLEKFTPGMYVLRIENTDGVTLKKLVVN